ncbi:MAG: aspartate aminotransferase family protein [Actinobacteria bacterium 13_1_20CM_2_65_11]|nr:MAG: aspartate aminotransferase family protein [Actinobacteria bacterium 13_1_20CM_2_65_11]
MSTPTARQVSTARVKELIARQEDRFRQARPRSQKLWQEARELMPRGVPSSFQDAAPQPVFVERGRGSRVWDVDGNEYIDFHNGFGVMVVGHAHPKIVDAVSKRIGLGSHFAQPVAEVVVVARELARRFGQPQWRFTNSGTESTLDAVRIARAFTGRQRLIKMEASYHGHHDALMVSVEPPPDLMGPPEEPASVPQSEGIPPAVVELTTVVPFNDLEALERAFTKHPDEVAAVIVEPAMMNVGIVLPDSGYLAGLRDTAHRHGALLIFDEVKTGATIAAGGATERFGVTPDLIALAKAIGGGLPCGAIGGRADVMEVIEEKRVAQMGTFNGNPLTMAASKVTLLEILDASAYSHFDALAETLQGGLDSVIGEYELPFHVITLAARGGVTYRSQRVRNYRDYLEIDKSNAYLAWLYQCNRGVLMAPGAEENWTLSVQHSVDDVQRYVDNFAEMARDLRS